MLKDINGDLLSAGTSNNGDGCLVTLGYFDNALATGNPFAGNWIPLTLEPDLETLAAATDLRMGCFHLQQFSLRIPIRFPYIHTALLHTPSHPTNQ